MAENKAKQTADSVVQLVNTITDEQKQITVNK